MLAKRICRVFTTKLAERMPEIGKLSFTICKAGKTIPDYKSKMKAIAKSINAISEQLS